MQNQPEAIRNTGESGYTLVEMIVIIAILSFLSVVMAMTFGMMTKVNIMNVGQGGAMGQVHLAASWISRDVQSADNVTAGLTGNWVCSMGRFFWTGTDINTEKIDYVITGGQLLRKVNGGQGVPVARYIEGVGTDTSFVAASTDNTTYTLKVKSVYNGSSSSGVYQITRGISGTGP